MKRLLVPGAVLVLTLGISCAEGPPPPTQSTMAPAPAAASEEKPNAAEPVAEEKPAPVTPTTEPAVKPTTEPAVEPSAQKAANPTDKLTDRTEQLDIGEKAPDFRLTDHTGTPQTLSTLLKSENVALVFYRSADW